MLQRSTAPATRGYTGHTLQRWPGYGFSGKPQETGWNTGRIARAWDTLMKHLGYTAPPGERTLVYKGTVSVPAAFTVFPDEIVRAPRSRVERTYGDLIDYNEVDKGGHFAAWQEPELFSEELRAAFRSLR